VARRRAIQLVPQDPGGSLNPRRRVGGTLHQHTRLRPSGRAVEATHRRQCMVTSALDVSVEAAILDLLDEIRATTGMALLTRAIVAVDRSLSEIVQDLLHSHSDQKAITR